MGGGGVMDGMDDMDNGQRVDGKWTLSLSPMSRPKIAREFVHTVHLVHSLLKTLSHI